MHSTKPVVTILVMVFCAAGNAYSANPNVGVLGTPGEASVVSGVGVISGYHCTSKDIDIYIDGVWVSKAGAGTNLLGTQGVCGRTDTGFSYLYAFNNLSNGQHTISAAANGVIFDSHTFTSFQSGGKAWLSGVSKTTTVDNFPAQGKRATLQWSESYQNFLITNIQNMSGTSDMTELVGSYTQTISISAPGYACSSIGAASGLYASTFNVTVSGNTLRLLGYTGADACDFGLTRQSGDSTTGYNLTGSAQCSYAGYISSVSVSNLRRYGSYLYGQIVNSAYGCTQTITLQ